MPDYDYSKLPVHMQGAMRRYIEHGIEPGGFLTAVLENNLVESAIRADEINKKYLSVYAEFLYWDVPSLCYGSTENVLRWISHKGLSGLTASREAKNA